MTVFCLVMVVVGEGVMGLLYHGEECLGHGQTVMVLALALLVSALSMPASYALQAMERPQATIWAGSVAAVPPGLLVWDLTIQWGLFGAPLGFLAGHRARTRSGGGAVPALLPPSAPPTTPYAQSPLPT